MKERKVFIAEIGTENSRSFGSSSFMIGGAPPETILIVADDYNEAANKAELYLENLPIDEKQSILDGDGSLKNLESLVPQILSIRASSAKIIW